MIRSLPQKKQAVRVLLLQKFVKSYGNTENPRLNKTGYGGSVSKGELPPREVYSLPRPKYGGIHYVTLLTGDSIIGRQGASYITSLLNSARVPVELERLAVSDNYFNSVLRNRTALHIDIQHGNKEKEQAMKVSNVLDLYAFVVKMRTFPGFNCRFPGVDIMLIGQNNLGDFSKLEYSPVNGVVENLRVVTDASSSRFWTYALRYATENQRKQIVVVHKFSQSPKSDGRFVAIGQCIQKESFPNIELKSIDIDKCISQLILNPGVFDVICANDRYCSFLATICSSVCGGANLFSAMEVGNHHAIFKPLQTKLSLTNYRSLCPYGIVSTCCDMLNYLRINKCAEALRNEMLRTMDDGIKTPEFGGKDSGQYVICNIMNRLQCKTSDEEQDQCEDEQNLNYKK